MTNTDQVIQKIDELLKDDNNLTTRSGLRLVMSAWKESLEAVGQVFNTHASMTTRIGNVENGLNELIQKLEAKEKKAEEERSKWRWAVIVPLIGMILSQIMQWIFR